MVSFAVSTGAHGQRLSLRPDRPGTGSLFLFGFGSTALLGPHRFAASGPGRPAGVRQSRGPRSVAGQTGNRPGGLGFTDSAGQGAASGPGPGGQVQRGAWAPGTGAILLPGPVVAELFSRRGAPAGLVFPGVAFPAAGRADFGRPGGGRGGEPEPSRPGRVTAKTQGRRVLGKVSPDLWPGPREAEYITSMKLYSRSSVVTAGVVGALAAIVLTLAGVWGYLALSERTTVAARLIPAQVNTTPVALSTQAPVSARPSIRSRVPSTIGAEVSKFCSR